MFEEDLENKMIDLVNKERRYRGLKILTPSVQLNSVARKHSLEQMKSGQIYHKSPVTGLEHGSRLTNSGYHFKTSGENVATSPDLYLSHNGLMNSPGHFKNIVGDWKEIGIGISRDHDGQLYITQLFATPVLLINTDNIMSGMLKGIKAIRVKSKLPDLSFIRLKTLSSVKKEVKNGVLNVVLNAAQFELQKLGYSCSESKIYYFCGFENPASSEQLEYIKNPDINAISIQLNQLPGDGRILGIILLMSLTS